MLATVAGLEVGCTHASSLRREHAKALEVLRAELEGEAGREGAEGPLVLAVCGERLTRSLRRRAVGARRGCEVVRVRVETPDRLAQAVTMVRAALRFASAVSDLRGPRRGVLAGLGRAPVEVVAGLCPGLSPCALCLEACPARALRPGEGDRPRVLGGLCTHCGACVAGCPRGALEFAHASWRALATRLEALLEGTAGSPAALMLWERKEPPPADGPRSSAQPPVPWVLPLELPRGGLRAGIVLRSLELGAGAVCAVVEGDTAAAASVDAAIAFASAVGREGVITRARSVREATGRLGEKVPAAGSAGGGARGEPPGRPEAAVIAGRLWGAAASSPPLRLTGPGSFGGTVQVSAASCTLCGLCVSACPSGALGLSSEAIVALSFDSRHCPGSCGLCAAACPSGALAVAAELTLPPERTTLVARGGTCASCGRRWPQAASIPALVARLAEGGAAPALSSFLSRCPTCRLGALSHGAGAGPSARPVQTDGHRGPPLLACTPMTCGDSP